MGHSVRQTVRKLPLAERFADTTRVLQVLAEPDSHGIRPVMPCAKEVVAPTIVQ